MFMPSPYEAVLRAIPGAAADADLMAATAPKIFADDAVLHVPGTSPLAGAPHGPHAIAQDYFQRQVALTENTLRLTTVRIDVEDGRGTLILHVTAQRGARVLDERQVFVFRLGGGKVQEGWIECADQEKFDAFFS
jgi:ketosteroid isomerase-like protein